MNKKVKFIIIGICVLTVLSLITAILFSKNTNNQPREIHELAGDNSIEYQPILGDPETPISIIEFGDFKCPGCRYFAKNIYPQIVNDFVKTKKANFKFVNFPFLGPDSLTAAAAVKYVSKYSPNDFWTYYEQIYNFQKDESENWATVEYLIEIARISNVNVDFSDMEKSLKSGEFEAEVQRELKYSRDIGIRSTPSLVVNNIVIETGNLNYQQIKEAINNAMSQNNKGEQNGIK